MGFSEKLSFLMELTATQNAGLGRALHIDPSQISRLRSGARGTPRKHETIRDIASYFAARCDQEYRRAALAGQLGNEQVRSPDIGRDALAAVLYRWLINEVEHTPDTASALYNTKLDVRFADESNPLMERVNASSMMVYVGDEGRRLAFRDMLDRLEATPGPHKLLIASDESVEWLMSDAAYYEETLERLERLLMNGAYFIRVVPPMQNATLTYHFYHFWMRLYVTGNVYSYYFPRIRDGVYHRTLIVAPGVMALSATSIGQPQEIDATFAYTDARIVDYQLRDFERFRAMCLPGLTLYDPVRQAEELNARLRKYYECPQPSIRKSCTLSFLTIPRYRKQQLQTSSTSASMRLLCAHVNQEIMPNEATLFSRSITDMITLSEPEDVLAGKARYCLDDSCAYTPVEYRRQLEGIVKLLRKHERYQVLLSTDAFPDFTLYAKEGMGILLFQRTPPYCVMELSSPGTLASLWAYLEETCGRSYSIIGNKQRVIATLNALIERLPTGAR